MAPPPRIWMHDWVNETLHATDAERVYRPAFELAVAALDGDHNAGVGETAAGMELLSVDRDRHAAAAVFAGYRQEAAVPDLVEMSLARTGTGWEPAGTGAATMNESWFGPWQVDQIGGLIREIQSGFGTLHDGPPARRHYKMVFQVAQDVHAVEWRDEGRLVADHGVINLSWTTRRPHVRLLGSRSETLHEFTPRRLR